MHRRFACWLIALLVPVAALAQPRIEVARDGAAYVVRAAVDLTADRRTAWNTITDYEHLPQFVPGIQSAQVLARAGSGDTERLLIEQTGEFRFFWYAQPVRVWLDVRHEAPVRVEARSVLPSGVDGSRSTVREYEGSYRLTVIDASRTRLVYEARFEPSQALLPVLGDYVVRRTISGQFGALADEVERRAAERRLEQAAR
jgi:hypothetical protein